MKGHIAGGGRGVNLFRGEQEGTSAKDCVAGDLLKEIWLLRLPLPEAPFALHCPTFVPTPRPEVNSSWFLKLKAKGKIEVSDPDAGIVSQSFGT